VEAAPIDRATSEDLVSLATDVGSAPMQVGAVLVLDGELDPGAVATAVGDRIRAVPRLRQRLVRTPPGCGRPVWSDDPDFDLGAHVRSIDCPAPGDEAALLEVAAEVVGTRLPSDRPLWRLTQVSGLQGGRSALVIAFHHVLADGIGGLAVLASLVDGAGSGPDDIFPRKSPSNRQLAWEALRTRVRSLAGARDALGRLRAALSQLRPGAAAHPTRCSLNRPTGPRRSFAVARTDLDRVHDEARDHGCTVNDVVLTAVAAALRDLLASRGETVDTFVVSVPVAARSRTSSTELGNEVGAVPVEVPATGDVRDRLARVSARTRAAKQTSRGSSSSLLGPAFRLLARVGIFGWFIDRQRLVHTFVTNLRGPDSRLRFLDRTIVDVVPVAIVTGNVTLSFAVLSYAGTLGTTVIADPDAVPDLHVLRDALQRHLDGLG
jgi:diacylglycerol O-acyltransferase / wax synthase